MPLLIFNFLTGSVCEIDAYPCDYLTIRRIPIKLHGPLPIRRFIIQFSSSEFNMEGKLLDKCGSYINMHKILCCFSIFFIFRLSNVTCGQAQIVLLRYDKRGLFLFNLTSVWNQNFGPIGVHKDNFPLFWKFSC